MAAVTYHSDTEHVEARATSALLVLPDGPEGHRVYFDKDQRPSEFVRMCAAMLGMILANPGLAKAALEVLRENPDVGTFRGAGGVETPDSGLHSLSADLLRIFGREAK